MMKCRITSVAILSAFVALVVASHAQAAVITPGSLVDLDAYYNATSAINEWTNNGTLGGKLNYAAPNGGGGAPNLSNDGTHTYYTSTGGTWGTSPAPGTNPAITGVENFSIEVWLKRLGNGTGSEHQLLGLSNAAGSQYIQLIWREGGDNDNILNVFMKGQTTTRDKFFDLGGGSAAFANNVWSQLFVTYNDTTKSLNVYQDATLIGSVTGTQDMDPSQLMNELVIFKANPAEDDTRIFNGNISRVRLYDVALTQPQIANNLAFGNTVVPEPAALSLSLTLLALLRRRRASL